MSGNLQMNKIFGALLGTGLLIVGVNIGSEMVFHTEKPEKMGYAIEIAEEGEAAGAADAVELLPDWGVLLPTADVAAGEAVFKKCASCHNADQGGAHATGPNLYGVVGRAMASAAGFAYSDAMKAHVNEAPVWSYDALYEFLKAPAKVVKGTKMSYAGLKKSEDRVSLIAYLRAQGSSGYAIPASDPSRQPGAAPSAPAEEAAASAAPASGDTPVSSGAESVAAPAAVAAKPAAAKVAAPKVSESKPAAPAPAPAPATESSAQ